MAIKEKTIAPDFALPDQNGTIRKLSDYLGKRVVLYFYPKDFTSGCTLEASNFRDDFTEYQKAGAVILGISPDSSKSHTSFCDQYSLPFTLLADEDHHVCELYGVWGRKSMYGKEYEGVLRTTFLIDAKGVIEKVFEKVKPVDHSKEVLTALKLS
jgi:peroxiredoxin Q/BCP